MHFYWAFFNPGLLNKKLSFLRAFCITDIKRVLKAEFDSFDELIPQIFKLRVIDDD